MTVCSTLRSELNVVAAPVQRSLRTYLLCYAFLKFFRSRSSIPLLMGTVSGVSSVLRDWMGLDPVSSLMASGVSILHVEKPTRTFLSLNLLFHALSRLETQHVQHIPLIKIFARWKNVWCVQKGIRFNPALILFFLLQIPIHYCLFGKPELILSQYNKIVRLCSGVSSTRRDTYVREGEEGRCHVHIHPEDENCLMGYVERVPKHVMYLVQQMSFPFLLLPVLSRLLLKGKITIEDGFKILGKFFDTTIYLGSYFSICQLFLCRGKVWYSKYPALFSVCSSFLASFTLLCESRSRRMQQVLFLLPFGAHMLGRILLDKFPQHTSDSKEKRETIETITQVTVFSIALYILGLVGQHKTSKRIPTGISKWTYAMFTGSPWVRDVLTHVVYPKLARVIS